MMLKEKITTLFACLMPLSTFSLGFSTFLLGAQGASIDMQFQVGEVFDLSSAINLKSSFDNLSYCEYGFINNETIEPKLYLTADAVFDMSIAKSILPSIVDNGVMNVEFSLIESSSIGVITNYSNSNVASFVVESPTIGVIPVISANNTFSDNFYYSILQISNISEDIQYIQLGISYCFDLTAAISTDFKTDIYPLIRNGGLSFTLKVAITA